MSRDYIEGGDCRLLNTLIPLRRVGDVEEVGEVCCFLASPLARYVTGTVVLPVDGGYLLTKSEGATPYPPGGVL